MYISSRLLFLLAPPMRLEQTECSETSAHKIQTPGNHPKEKNTTYVFIYSIVINLLQFNGVMN